MKQLGSGAWKLLSTPVQHLLALSDHCDGLLTVLSRLHPRGAVLAGDMSEMQPSDLLNFLHQGRRTGVLLTRSDGTERGIVLIEGNVAWACSTSPGERLGELLARMGLADRAKIDAMLREQAASGERKRLGRLLVDKGALTPEALARGVRHQVKEIFLGLLVARTGTSGLTRVAEEDFRVEELPLYEPSGAGEHLYLTVEKIGRTTQEVVKEIAQALGARERDAGTAGLKDKRGVTVQRISVTTRVPSEEALKLEGRGFRVLAAARHGNKLRPGHLRGNRFRIVVRGVASDGLPRAQVVCARLREGGAANLFGPQR